MTDPLFARFGREFQAGEVLFREGEPGDVLYVIQSGIIRITKHIGGTEKLLAILGPGDFLGELAVLNSKPRTATAAAAETARCLLVDAKTLETMVMRNSEIAVRLIKRLAKRLDAANALVEILMHTDPKTRIMLSLARHADLYGEVTDDGIRLRVSGAQIAEEVGVDERVANEVILRLSRLKMVEDEGSQLVVTDIGRLREFLELLEMPQKFGGES